MSYNPFSLIKPYLQSLIFMLALWGFSPFAAAANELPWKLYLLTVMGISVMCATFLSIRNKRAEGFIPKLLLAGLYFWVFTFAQLMVLSLIYYLNK
ncbi:hypothetical protein ACUR5C_13115 [Aliikangiella sp. IMCC44653]